MIIASGIALPTITAKNGIRTKLRLTFKTFKSASIVNAKSHWAGARQRLPLPQKAPSLMNLVPSWPIRFDCFETNAVT